jgi:hypothetical protein
LKHKRRKQKSKEQQRLNERAPLEQYTILQSCSTQMSKGSSQAAQGKTNHVAFRTGLHSQTQLTDVSDRVSDAGESTQRSKNLTTDDANEA